MFATKNIFSKIFKTSQKLKLKSAEERQGTEIIYTGNTCREGPEEGRRNSTKREEKLTKHAERKNEHMKMSKGDKWESNSKLTPITEKHTDM